MKFEQELVLNSVPEWRENYLNYEALKRQLYNVERDEEKLRRTSLAEGDLMEAGDISRESGSRIGVAEVPLLYQHNFAASAAATEDESVFETMVRVLAQLRVVAFQVVSVVHQ